MANQQGPQMADLVYYVGFLVGGVLGYFATEPFELQRWIRGIIALVAGWITAVIVDIVYTRSRQPRQPDDYDDPNRRM